MKETDKCMADTKWVGEQRMTSDAFIWNVGVGAVYPSMIHLNVTNACNKNCDFCSVPKDVNRNKYMMLETVSRVNREIKSMKAPTQLHLHMSGEPLKHPGILRIIETVKDLYTGLCTNGKLLHYYGSQLLKYSSLNQLTVSVTDKESLDALNAFLDFQKNVCPSSELKIIGKYFMDLPDSGPVNPLCDDFKIAQIRKPGERIERKDPSVCYHRLFNPAINWNGDFLMCCADHMGETSVGNVHEHSIHTLWHKMKRQKPHDLCGRCI